MNMKINFYIRFVRKEVQNTACSLEIVTVFYSTLQADICRLKFTHISTSIRDLRTYIHIHPSYAYTHSRYHADIHTYMHTCIHWAAYW
jgi:hypothetical protein